MAALTALMTRFCAGEDRWLARSNKNEANLAPLKPEIATASPDATGTSVKTTVTTPMIRRSMLDSVALSPVSGRSHSKRAIQAHPAWTAYLIIHARFMAPQTNHPIIQIEIVGVLNRMTN